MADPGADNSELMTDAGHCPSELVAEFAERVTADIGQFPVLQMLPEPLVGIELRRVGGQGLQAQALRRPLGQEVLDDLSAVDGRAVPDHQQLTRQVAQQVPKEADDIRATQGPLLHLQENPPGWGSRADSRQTIARERHP